MELEATKQREIDKVINDTRWQNNEELQKFITIALDVLPNLTRAPELQIYNYLFETRLPPILPTTVKTIQRKIRKRLNDISREIRSHPMDTNDNNTMDTNANNLNGGSSKSKRKRSKSKRKRSKSKRKRSKSKKGTKNTKI
jgi:hypothetical protein